MTAMQLLFSQKSSSERQRLLRKADEGTMTNQVKQKSVQAAEHSDCTVFNIHVRNKNVSHAY